MLNKCMGLCRNVIFYSALVLGMVIFGNELETK